MKTTSLTLILLSGFFSGYSQGMDSAEPKKIVLPWFVERFKISAGAIYVVNRTNIQVELTDQAGTDINLEKDMRFNKEIGTFLANFEWQISRRSKIALNYFKVNRSSNHVLDKDIIFEDNTYYANSSVSTFFNTKIYQISYGYSILSRPKYEAGIYIGTHILSAETGITAVGMSGGGTKQNNFGFTAPLPDIGIWGGYAISKRLGVNMNVSYFALTFQNKNGRLLAFNLNFIYKIYKQLDITLGYTGLDFKVNVVKSDVTGDFKWGYNGPVLALNFSFGKKHWTH